MSRKCGFFPRLHGKLSQLVKGEKVAGEEGMGGGVAAAVGAAAIAVAPQPW